jgi:hypothetical protein
VRYFALIRFLSLLLQSANDRFGCLFRKEIGHEQRLFCAGNPSTTNQVLILSLYFSWKSTLNDCIELDGLGSLLFNADSCFQ